jgi:hypothetical protein
MPTLYSYTFTPEGEGPWWGIRCPKIMYGNMIRQMQETTRCFVYLTNVRGETLAIAVEGPHNEGDDNIFAPDWVFRRLQIVDGDDITVDQILEKLPSGDMVKLSPLTGTTVEGPMFLDGLTEALNKLGIVQEGLLSAIVDPSMPEIHEFMVEDLMPAKVCLADGELRVDLQRALDRPPTPEVKYEPEPEPEPFEEDCGCQNRYDAAPPIINTKPKGYVPFGGTGYRLDGK